MSPAAMEMSAGNIVIQITGLAFVYILSLPNVIREAVKKQVFFRNHS